MIRPAATLARHSRPRRVLVVDDDRRTASVTAQWLSGLGWHARAVASAEEAIPLLSDQAFDVAIVDGQLIGDGARRIAGRLRLAGMGTAVVIALPPSASRTAAAAVSDAIVAAPIRDDELLAALDGAIEAAGRRSAGAAVERLLVGESPAVREVLELVDRLADAPVTLLITGESGTGKSLLAREIHRASRRRPASFVEVACGSLSESLLESELFGHVAGAFTGATVDRPGKFLQADGGTIFLDEIATATPALQVKLLRVLQDMRFEPVGGCQTQSVDARVILATNEDLAALVAAGRFRADLFWRVNVITVEMPTLRRRVEDVPLLAEHFLANAIRRGARPVEGFSAAAIDALIRHTWPGNVRELEHAVEHAVFLGRDPLIGVADLPPSLGSGTGRAGVVEPSDEGISLKRALARPERQLILEALERNGWRRDAAARELGINRTTLYKKLRRLGIDLARLEPQSAAHPL